MRRCEAKRPVLAVRVSYEADRLGGQLLADAFERLAPTIMPEALIADTAVRRGRP